MANGWWNLWGALSGCVAAYQPVGASSLNASYVNLANPGKYTAAATEAVTFSPVRGWQRVSSVGIIDTTVVIGASSWSSIVRHSGASPLSFYRYHYGLTTPGKQHLFGYAEGAALHSYSNNGILAPAPALAAGVMAIAGQTGYLNGKAEGVIGGAWSSGTLSANVLVARGMSAGLGPIDIAVQAVAIYDRTLPAAAVWQLSKVMERLPALRPMDIMARYMPNAASAIQFRRAFGLRTGSRGVPE